MQWDILLEKYAKNKLNPSKVKEKLGIFASQAEKNRHFGFSASVGRMAEPELVYDEEEGKEVYRYLAKIRLKKPTVTDARVAQNHFKMALENVLKAAEADNWKFLSEQAQDFEEETGTGNLTVESVRPSFVVPELTGAVMQKYFRGVYERDAHIRIIHDAVKTYMASIARNARDRSQPIQRSHILLKGKPAGCKTTLFERFKTWFDEEGTDRNTWHGELPERVLFVDGPTMTKAGLENWLLNLAGSNNLPEFVVIEEIEKQDMNNLLTLISVMGSGYVSKMNARIGRERSIANVVIWATCNDEDIVKQFRKGALWSRFTHRLHCARPSPGLMHQILLERVFGMGGDPEWADRAIEFAYKTIPEQFDDTWDDPREILGLLDGGDRLLDYSYQTDIMEVLRSERSERLQSIS